MLPAKFLEKLDKSIDPAVFAIKRPTTFRVNTLKIDCEEQAFITTAPLRQIQELDIYKNGEIYVQSLSSMIPAKVLDPRPGDFVLDICAAPGSKTSQMAALMRNEGQIIANDNSRIRIYKLEANLRNLGVTNTSIIQSQAQTLWQKYPEAFDKVLADVPCSMEGRFYTPDPKTYKDWSPKKVKQLAKLQQFILRSAFGCTKPGGIIVYSTCTLSTTENEGVVEWLLKKERGKVELVSSERIAPSEVMEGFFVAKLRKLK
jgi:NOL1/NOP2/sun family putative RNA methylase